MNAEKELMKSTNKITRESTFRGTKYYDLVEHYLKNEDINKLDNVLPLLSISII